MIAELGKTLPLPRMVFVGEPTEMRVVDAHKGPVRWRVEVTGRAAHSSMAHLGVNAIPYAGRSCRRAGRMEEELKACVPRPRFDPPFTTLQVTEIDGGTASNIMPVPCWFGWEIRRCRASTSRSTSACGPSPPSTACRRCCRVAPEAGIEIAITNQVPAFGADAKSGIVPLTLKLATERDVRGVLRHRGQPFPARRRAVHRVRPRQHRPGAYAQRVRAHRRTGEVPAFLDRVADWAEA